MKNTGVSVDGACSRCTGNRIAKEGRRVADRRLEQRMKLPMTQGGRAVHYQISIQFPYTLICGSHDDAETRAAYLKPKFRQRAIVKPMLTMMGPIMLSKSLPLLSVISLLRQT
jgi:hypothetical protein